MVPSASSTVSRCDRGLERMSHGELILALSDIGVSRSRLVYLPPAFNVYPMNTGIDSFYTPMSLCSRRETFLLHVPWPGQMKRQQALHIPRSLAYAAFFSWRSRTADRFRRSLPQPPISLLPDRHAPTTLQDWKASCTGFHTP